MHKTPSETSAFIQELKNQLPTPPPVDVMVAPPYVALPAAVEAVKDAPIFVAAQNVHWEPQGAYTGEIATNMLTDLGVSQVIIGHSERRQYFGETDQTVNKRTVAALEAGLTAVVCIGETLDQREAQQTMDVLRTQITTGLADLEGVTAQNLILAYEPVWAIGTGKTATPEIAQEAHRFIRETVEQHIDKTLANQLRILYGGSVKPDNAADLMAQPDIDGALVGGASLKIDSFLGIITRS
jgi:triosephosphate isomerase